MLESNQEHYQLQATQVFLHYAVKEEPTPPFHRNYQFLVERFGGLALGNEANKKVAGLQALRGIIKKTSSNEIQMTLWQKRFISHLINSFIVNLTKVYSEDNADARPEGSRRLSLHRYTL